MTGEIKSGFIFRKSSGPLRYDAIIPTISTDKIPTGKENNKN